ncbi:MAG: type IV secretion system protein [Steroidobacteraceae bacterium]
MNRIHQFSAALLALISAALVQPCMAQIPVTDLGAIAQLITQVANMENQLVTMRNQLVQAESTLKSMTGSRGMEQLLGGQNRNYLPTDWNSLASVINNSSTAYSALAANLQAIVSGNSVMSTAQISQLGPNERTAVSDARISAATSGAVSRSALADTSSRFDDLQQLISAIGTTTDQKAILELQARINAEQTMISNDQSKLQALYKTTEADEELRKQRVRERAIADVGSFATLAPMGL